MTEIVHLMNADKFFPDYIEFLKQHFPLFERNHLFFITGDYKKFNFPSYRNIIFLKKGQFGNLKFYFRVLGSAFKCKKLIFHGLFNLNFIRLFSLIPISGKKMYWAILGGDLYQYRNRNNFLWWRHEVFRIFLIKKIKHHIAFIAGDHILAERIYVTTAMLHRSFLYPSNIVSSVSINRTLNNSKCLNILVGNSATKSNRHKLIIDKLAEMNINKSKIFCPLSYGSRAYADEIEKYGKAKLGKKFNALKSFLPFKDYLKILDSIDIAIMGHNRQQAIGNIVNLLARGKKVYLDPEVTTFSFFHELGIKIYNINELDLKPIPNSLKKSNAEKLLRENSVERLVEQWRTIFEC